MIRKCTDSDFEAIYEIINDAAQAYKSVIPDDRWHEPYMTRIQLRHEIEDGVRFWGIEEEHTLVGIMGIQDKGDVCLIRHAYVKTNRRNKGIGAHLLRHLESMTEKPMLIGTWADATWAIRFYEKNGYRLLSKVEKNDLLRKYWSIPERQVETSVVLADGKWSAERPDSPDCRQNP
jgi:N-acetylglutamate synthase-like GNAT family acetyltransferase